MVTPPINVGVIGYGYSGRNFHCYLIGFERRLRLYGVVTRDPERRRSAEREYGVRVFGSLGEMLGDENIQLVVVATPHDTHAPLAIQAMEAGRHVVVEKIMCMNTAEADAMIEASRRNGVMLTVFHNRRWDGDYLTVRKALKDGLLGRPYLIEESLLGYRERVMPDRWRSQMKQSGGILYDWGAHFLDHAIQLARAPVDRVFCLATRRRGEVDIESYLRCLIHFEDDLTFGIELGNMARIDRPRWYVLGELGALTKTGVDPQERAMNAGDIDAAVEDPRDYARVRTVVDGEVRDMTIPTLRGDWKAFYRNVADHLVDGKELAVKPEEVRRAVAVAEAARRSAEEGRSVELHV